MLLDTGYNALMRESQRSLLSLPGDDNDDNEEGGEEGAGLILSRE